MWETVVTTDHTDRTGRYSTRAKFSADSLLELRIAVARYMARVQSDQSRKHYWHTSHPVISDGDDWGELVTDIDGTWVRYKKRGLNADGLTWVRDAFDYVLSTERWSYV
jgi:hypothetical protein